MYGKRRAGSKCFPADAACEGFFSRVDPHVLFEYCGNGKRCAANGTLARLVLGMDVDMTMKFLPLNECLAPVPLTADPAAVVDRFPQSNVVILEMVLQLTFARMG